MTKFNDDLGYQNSKANTTNAVITAAPKDLNCTYADDCMLQNTKNV